MVKISVVIITYNEEKNIARCIDSIRPLADEIVVVDSFSRDRTKLICEEKAVKFIENPFKTHIDQKNFAVTQAGFDHILSLDADEYLSDELLHSILAVKQTWPYEAYSMKRLSNYGGKWIRFGSWYPDKKIRLWNRNNGVWGGENPHDKVILRKGTKVLQLNGDLLHSAYKNSTEAVNKIQRYSEIFAHENTRQKTSSVFKILFRTSFAFFKSYILKRGILDGFEGLMVSAAVSNHVFYKYAKLYENNRRAALGKRIVISRTDNLGDVVLTLPIAGYLKREVPGIEIYFLGKKYTRAIIDQCIYIDGFLDQDEVVQNPGLLETINADSIIFIYPDRQLAKIAQKTGIKNRVGTSHRWYNWLYCNYIIDFSRVRSNLHESQLNFKLLSPFSLGADIDLKEMSTFYGLRAKKKDFSKLISEEKFNLIIHPKSRGSAREWGLENFNELIASLPPEHFNIFITGLPEEEDIVMNEHRGLFDHPHVINMMGKLTMDEMLSFINAADGLLACSTGVLHLAAALGKYALGIYAPIRPIHPGRWKPIGTHAYYLVLDKECNLCEKDQVCSCIRAISVAQVRIQLLTFFDEWKMSEKTRSHQLLHDK